MNEPRPPDSHYSHGEAAPSAAANQSTGHSVAGASAPGSQRAIQSEDISLVALLSGIVAHDHLCLIYETREEWAETIVAFIIIGLKRGERCLCIADANRADDIRSLLTSAGVAVAAAERAGKLTMLNDAETYCRGGSFDPTLMIAFLKEETEKALEEGYPALRITGEASWVLQSVPGSERLLEYEAMLNRDLFPRYKCLALCQYDRWAFDPALIKGVILTHPKLVHRGHVYRNIYHVPAADYLNATSAAHEAQHLLNSLERERLNRESLHAEEERYRTLFEQSIDAIWLSNPDGTGNEVNQAWLDMFGYTRDDLRSMNAIDIYIDPQDRERFMERIATDGFVREEVRFRKKDGSIIECERSVVGLKDASGALFRMQGVIRDITESKQAEETLRASEERLRSLTTYLESVREQERTGIARELHDQVGQALTAMRMDLVELTQKVRHGLDISTEKMAAMVQLVDQMTDDVRRISSELRPGLLDDVGLVAALEWQLNQIAQRTGMDCTLTATLSHEPGKAVSTALYRVCQELLTNVIRHAQAQSVRVQLDERDGHYVLTVIDDGRGIKRSEAESPSSLGLIGMRERLRPLEGTLELVGHRGKGTTAQVMVSAL